MYPHIHTDDMAVFYFTTYTLKQIWIKQTDMDLTHITVPQQKMS